MADIVSAETRSRMMAGIRSKNTKQELLVRRKLFARGLRFRIHLSSLPGKPDIVLAKYRAAIFIHGCFWHGHNCPLFKLPSTRPGFWMTKMDRNKTRDRKVGRLLASDGWRRLIIWECAIRGASPDALEKIIDRVEAWIKGSGLSGQIRGRAKSASN